MSNENFKQTIGDIFKDKIITNLSQLTATLPFPNRITWTSLHSKHTKTTKLDTDTQYEIRLDLPSWKLTSPSSLRILNLLMRSANNAEHFLCRVCTFAAAWTSVLVTFLKFTSATTHILTTRDVRLAANSHKLRALYFQNSVPSPLYLHICINPLLTEQCAIFAVSPYLY